MFVLLYGICAVVQGLVVQKPINANPRLEINQGVYIINVWHYWLVKVFNLSVLSTVVFLFNSGCNLLSIVLLSTDPLGSISNSVNKSNWHKNLRTCK